MQTKFRQQTKNGCGSLSLANILDDHRFALGLENCQGESVMTLNKKLADFGHELCVEVIYMTSQLFKTSKKMGAGQKNLFKLCAKDVPTKIRNTQITPFLMTIGNARGRNDHMVALLHELKTDLFYVVDSCKEKVVQVTLDELIDRYKIISVALIRMTNHEDPCNYITMGHDQLSHIFEG